MRIKDKQKRDIADWNRVVRQMDSRQRNINEWNKMKLMGKRKYIWVNGVLYWGLPMAIITAFIIEPIRDGLKLNNYFTNHNLIKGFIINIIWGLIGGLFYGFVIWIINEKRYKNY